MTLLGEFSEAELKRFSIRYENGYDIKSDERYNAWLRRYHPTEKPTKRGIFKRKINYTTSFALTCICFLTFQLNTMRLVARPKCNKAQN